MNNLKKVSFIFVLFLVTSFFIFAQKSENPNNQPQVQESVSNSTDELNSSLFDQWDNEQQQKKSSGAATFWLFIRMIIVLALVIACIYGVMWFLKKQNKIENNDDQFLRQVAKISIGTNKSVQVVTLIDKAYLIGVSDNSVNLISEIDDKELINAMNLYADSQKNTKKPRSFSDILEIFMPNGPKDTNVFEESNNKFNDMTNKQRDRLHNEE
ncbi:MAG: flagellar biosynthetic protein FliO [Treponema sp.]|nr:flagellar biosynthetic protein FliO [Treponema sp.]